MDGDRPHTAASRARGAGENRARGSILVRRAEAGDAETIHRFIAELAAFEREPEAVEATPETLRRQLLSPRPPFECWLAEVGGEPAGFALFFRNYSTWRGREGIYLEDLYVAEKFRGMGVGAELFRAVARVAHERGAGRLELSVLDWNESAIAFYRAFGAKPLGEWTTYRLDEREIAAVARCELGPRAPRAS
ncbi:MAG: GNAT family N-acetyltransferase [Planctomycetota bacterium]